MVQSIVKTPLNADSIDYDFLAFSFNGKHSYDDFGIYRISDGDRYNAELTPQMNDKTVDNVGDGMFFFGTTHKQRVFNVNFAFDHMDDKTLRKMKQWLNGKEIHDLWFDEEPYKVYSAKVTGTATMKYVAFEEPNKKNPNIIDRIYKGEGTIQFTAYWPYAHTPDYVETSLLYLEQDKVITIEPITIQKNSQVIIKGKYYGIIQLLHNNYVVTEIQGDGLSEINYSEKLTGTENARIFNSILLKNDVNASIEIIVTINPEERIFVTTLQDGRHDSSYSKFKNKSYWRPRDNLSISATTCKGENPGDIEAPFILTDENGINSEQSKTYKITEDLQITVGGAGQSAMSNIIWDSKTGMVSAKIGTSEKNVPISYTGNSLGGIPVGGLDSDKLKLNGATLKYHYWYY